MDWITNTALLLFVLWTSLTLHEFAHAWAAWRLGDDTARREGRLTLNPLAHIDPVGTFLLPVLGIPFGWARPVPIDPRRFRRDVDMGYGIAVSAAAGPASNLLLTAVTAPLCALSIAAQAPDLVTSVLLILAIVNVHLAAFNMIPVVPLDGSRVADHLVPGPLRQAYAAIREQSLLVMILFFLVFPRIGLDPFAPLRDLVLGTIRALVPLFS